MQDEIYIVRVQRPDGVSIKDMEEYITDAVRAWKGGMFQSNPLTELDRDTVKVQRGTYIRLRKAASPSYKAPKVKIKSFDPHMVD